jgi:hypothetical protein
VEMIDRTKHKKYENMTCFAKYKFAADKPAFRVHIWEVFDEANMASKNFNRMFEIIENKLCQMYEDQGFESEDEEIEMEEDKSEN